MTWPLSWDDVVAARVRIARHLSPTPLRHYATLDEEVGHGIRVLVKHENHLPTNAFKARNAMSFMTALDRTHGQAQRTRGVVAATRGNHGAGLAWAGAELGVPVVICVPHGNNPEKNATMRAFGAELVEAGRDYDEAAEVAQRLVSERGLVLAHSTNDVQVLAGAATLGAELCEQAPVLDAIVVAIGGGSQAVGALTAVRALRPHVAVYGVQASGASAAHDSWHAKARRTIEDARTFADGLATRSTYDLTWPALAEGLAGFVAVDDAAIAEAIRVLMRTTHNVAEGAGAAGLAGLLALRETLAEKTVAIVLSGSNIDEQTLRRVFTREL